MSSFGGSLPQGVLSAYAGFTGIASYGTNADSTTLRVETCTVKATQGIEGVNDIDGTVSNGRFLLQPLKIEGDIGFKFDIFSTGAGDGGAGYTVAKQMLNDAYRRDQNTGNLAARADQKQLKVRYHDTYGYTYGGILINTLRISCTAGQAVEFSAGLKGISRTRFEHDDLSSFGNGTTTRLPSPVRVATYNDLTLALEDNDSDPSTAGSALDSSHYFVREFSISIDNQLEDIYTLGGQLRAYDIVAKKRKVTGSFKILSNAASGVAALKQYIEEHETRAISRLKLTLNINKGAGVSERFLVLPAVVPSLEDISLTNNVSELTFNFEAFGHDNDASGISPYQNVAFLPDTGGITQQDGYFPFA